MTSCKSQNVAQIRPSFLCGSRTAHYTDGPIGGSPDLFVDLEALLRGGEIGSNGEMSEWLDEDNPVLLLDADADDLDLEDLDEGLVFKMRRGIG